MIVFVYLQNNEIQDEKNNYITNNKQLIYTKL